MYVYILFKNTHTHNKKAKEERTKAKEIKEEKNVVANSICRKSNLIRYRLRICSVYF